MQTVYRSTVSKVAARVPHGEPDVASFSGGDADTLATIDYLANRIADKLFLPLGNLFWSALVIIAAVQALGLS